MARRAQPVLEPVPVRRRQHWTGGPRSAVQRENSQWVDYSNWPAPDAQDDGVRSRCRRRQHDWPSHARSASSASQVRSLARSGRRQRSSPRSVLRRLVVVERRRTITAAPGKSGNASWRRSSMIPRSMRMCSSQHHNRRIASSTRQRVLTAPVHMSGIPWVSLELRFDQPAAVVSAASWSIAQDGTVRLVTRGWADPQNHKSIWRNQAHQGRTRSTRSSSSCSRTTTNSRRARASASSSCPRTGCSRCARRPARS